MKNFTLERPKGQDRIGSFIGTDAEQGLIACLFHEPDRIPETDIPLEAFTVGFYRSTFDAMRSLAEVGEEVDEITVAEKMAPGDQDVFLRLYKIREAVETAAHYQKFRESLEAECAIRATDAGLKNAMSVIESVEYTSAEKLATLHRELEAAGKIVSATQSKTPKGFTVWTPAEILAYEVPPGQDLLGEGYLQKGRGTALVGPPGVGKSRLSYWLPVCQITGRDWCGIPTGGEPQKWLLIGNENNLRRQKADLSKIMGNMSGRESDLINDNLRLHVLSTVDDCRLDLSDNRTKARLRATIAREKPDAVILDPFTNFVDGDENKTQDVRQTLNLIYGIIQGAVLDCTVLLVHHSRTGAGNIRQAVGYDAGNFMRGSKALLGDVRCVINLAPGDAEDRTKLVMSCGKANDCEAFATRGLVFNPENFRYDVDPDFNLEDWINDVEGKRGNKACSIADVVEAVRAGKHKRKEIVEHVNDLTGASESTIRRRIKDACEADKIQPTQPRGCYTLK